MSDINKYIEIDNYLNGKLSAEELMLFNAKIANDPAFAEEVEFVKLANQVIISGTQANIKARLQTIHKQHQNQQNRKKWGFGGLTLIAALTITGVLVNTYSKNESNAPQMKPSLAIKTEKSVKIKDKTQIEVLSVKSTNQQIEEHQQTLPNNIVPHIVDSVINDTPQEKNGVKENDQKNQPPIKAIENKIPQINNVAENTNTIDPCEKTYNVIPNYDIQWPCLGDKKGSFQLFNYSDNDIFFTEFSLDGGKTYSPLLETKTITTGAYELIVRDNEGCLTKAKRVNVSYGNCNFVIQPNYGKYWKLNLSEDLDYPIVLEIRNARTAELVYQENIEQEDTFIWQGKDLNNTQVPLGNYVYMFKSTKKGLIAQGQITVVY